MDEADEPSGMAYTGGQYQTKNTVVAVGAGATVKLVNADASRIYIRFTRITAAAGTYTIYPQPAVAGILSSSTDPGFAEFKWRDCPSLVAGEWYVFSGNIHNFLVTECKYLRG